MTRRVHAGLIDLTFLLLPAGCFHPPGESTPRPDPERPPAPWHPLDPIPGWEDYPCEELGVPDLEVEDVHVDDAFLLMHPQLDPGRVRVVGLPSEARFTLVPCFGDDPCGEEEFDWRGTWIDIHLHGGYDRKSATERGQGWYLPVEGCTGGSRSAFIFTSMPEQYEELGLPDTTTAPGWCDDFWSMPSETSVCLSRVRPDVVDGVAWVRILTESEGGLVPDGQGRLVRIALHLPFAEHGGFYSDGVDMEPGESMETMGIEDLPDEIRTQFYVYHADQPFNKVWPWEQITDPEIRAWVREKYRPYAEDEAMALRGGVSGTTPTAQTAPPHTGTRCSPRSRGGARARRWTPCT